MRRTAPAPGGERAGRARPGGGPRVLYFGTYDRSIGRNAVVLEALAAAGIEVTECHARLWRDTTDKLRAVRSNPLGTAARQAAAWLRLLDAYRAAGPYDAMIVGATAHLDLPLARLLATVAGRPLVFDPLVSALETVRDRRLVSGPGRLRALGALERLLLGLPDRIWLDTAAHADALEREVGLARHRVAVVPAGAPREYRALAVPYDARRASVRRPLRVVYFGQFIPLHGVDVVLRAAHLLSHRQDIVFELVGRGQELPSALRLAGGLGLGNVRFVPRWLPAERLAGEHIAPADVCLGLFGSEPKATRVVPFKVFIGLASGRAVLTADSPAVRELLRPGVEVMTVPADDPAALAGALEDLADHPGRRSRLAALGQVAYDQRFSAAALGKRVGGELAALARNERAALHGPRHAWRVEALTDVLLGAAPEGVLLDEGCGHGDGALRLAARHRRVVAVDADLDRLRLARDLADRHSPRNRPAFVCADIAALPIADGSVSGVLAGEVLEHVPDDRAAAREVGRVLAPGGALALSVPSGPDRWSEADRAVGHVRRYDRASLLALLAAGDLTPVVLRGWGLLFGRAYDRLVLRPAQTARPGPLRRLAGRVGASRALRRACRPAFVLDARLDAGEHGSGWWALARFGPDQVYPARDLAEPGRGGRARERAGGAAADRGEAHPP